MTRYSDVFADASSISDKVSKESPDIVELSESARVLTLLLSVIYRLDGFRQKLKDADFDDLKAVAEAAEKYNIEVASCICELYMRCAIF